LARRLLDAGHLLDVGIAQIDSMNFAGFGVTLHTIFDPCVNLNVGARILSDDYAFAIRRYRDAQVALRHAIGMYNTGRLNAGTRYVARVLAAADTSDHYAQSSGIISKRDAMQSPLLVRSPTTHLKPRGVGLTHVTPARAPILVSNAPRLFVF
jgi:hypothetical protein